MQYPGATTFPGMILWGASTNGPAAPPGTYQVRLTVDGRAQTQPLVIKRHPLYTDVSDADLNEQFALAIKIRDKVSEANTAVIQIRSLKSQVADRLTKSQDPALKAAGGCVREEPERGGRRDLSGPQPERPGPAQLPHQDQQPACIASLLGAVNRGDGKPIGNAAPIFTDLTGELKVQTDQLDKVLKSDMAKFNAEAKRLGLEIVSVAPVIRM